jgi:hypothetical protein
MNKILIFGVVLPISLKVEDGRVIEEEEEDDDDDDDGDDGGDDDYYYDDDDDDDDDDDVSDCVTLPHGISFSP